LEKVFAEAQEILMLLYNVLMRFHWETT